MNGWLKAAAPAILTALLAGASAWGGVMVGQQKQAVEITGLRESVSELKGAVRGLTVSVNDAAVKQAEASAERRAILDRVRAVEQRQRDEDSPKLYGR